MGVRHLDTLIRKKVENGCFKVNIEHEIREYYRKASTTVGEVSPPPPPVLVIDVFALSGELDSIDFNSLIYGARFNVGFWIIDRFLRKLKSLGVSLEFFMDGSVQDFKIRTWCERKDRDYQDAIAIINAVDEGVDIETILTTVGAPGCGYALEYLAEMHGRLTVSLERECDQELAAFASKVNAFAIISNDSDFLIYEGNWRYWSSRDLDIDTLETLEYNRHALLQYLGLTFAQMPLFATLCGNDIVKLEELKRFHFSLGQYCHKMTNVAKFVQPQDPNNLQNILEKVFGPHNRSGKDRFWMSLQFYKTDFVTSSNDDPVEEILLKHPNPFVYQLWHKQPHVVSLGLVDMRSTELGKQVPSLVLRILLRTAGIIVLSRQKGRKIYIQTFVIKLTHESNHRIQRFPVQFPSFTDPPTLMELFSTDPFVMANLENTKLLLLSWIVSDRLDYRRLRPILRPLLPTVVTLYHLVENRILQLFEADLLLQVAYDVVTETYDPKSLEFPTTVESRPFRLAFIFRIMYRFVAIAMNSIGLNLRGFREDPPFDGVLFHTKYRTWDKSEADLGKIAQWRIYTTISQ
ncbi:AAEL005000-PA [Aedes aegypti]|uniref:AAEL005000-PA n=1 Tax=Aedes aegypti TaxID=7159 RepID=Q17BD4_AEDAE|nr:AAEL005000-PA [Aedes aegypti]